MTRATAREAERNVRLLRSRGDALARSGRVGEASDAYRGGLAIVEDWLAGSPAAGGHDRSAPADDRVVAADTANLLGIRGGLFRRLGELDRALDSYRKGAQIEAVRGLPATYNRANAIKLALIIDDRKDRTTLAQLHEELVELRRALEQRLTTDERATDDAWLWADLGDVRLLLGDDEEATAAYRTYSGKARSTSPASTLSLIREVVTALRDHRDPAADRVASSLKKVEQVLGA
jgi:tetratricopeptide (TPR) repeat protein